MIKAFETIPTKSIYERVADLLEYPGVGWPSLIISCGELITDEKHAAFGAFTDFCEGVGELSLFDLQELYTRTFDLNPVCALDIGYHLFGENYKRGVFLANLRETEAQFDLGQEHQLPDYLPVLLRLVAELEDEELRCALIVECMIPALLKMHKALSDADNPYRYLLEAVRTILQSEVGAGLVLPSVRGFNLRAGLPVIQPRRLEYKL